MLHRCQTPRPIHLVFLLGMCVTTPACQITLPEDGLLQRPEANISLMATPPATPTVISPQTAIQWSALTSQSFPRRGLRGRSVVGSDGRMNLGPYGSVEVAGLTPEQAKAAVLQHLANYQIPQPEVELAVVSPAAGSGPRSPQEGPPTTDSSLARVAHVPAGQLSVEVGPSDVPARPAEILPPLCGRAFPGQVPNELGKLPLPPYVIEPPDILLVESTQGIRDQPVRGQHLVRPDGTVGLGIYGSVFVGGMTLDQAKEAIARQLARRIEKFDPENLNVDVLAYNSKVYYVITDGGGYGEQVFRVPVTGSETVLDAIGQINGLPPVASKKHIWVARRSLQGGPEQVLPVDWFGITQRGAAETNYQLLPGDRVYVKADKWRTFDAGVAKVLSPFERILGTTLLGSETVNSIRNRGSVSGGR